MSLFDAFVRDFFGADPFAMRPTQPPRPQPMQVQRVTQMVEGLIMQPQNGGQHFGGHHTTRDLFDFTPKK